MNFMRDMNTDAHPVPIANPMNVPGRPPGPGGVSYINVPGGGRPVAVNQPHVSITQPVKREYTPAAPPKDYLKINAVLCLLCFWVFPFGLVAIARSLHVRKRVKHGPMWQARVMSTGARKCGIITAVIGVLVLAGGITAAVLLLKW